MRLTVKASKKLSYWLSRDFDDNCSKVKRVITAIPHIRHNVSNRVFAQQFIQANIKDTKVPHFWSSVEGIHRWTPLHKGLVTRKTFLCHDALMVKAKSADAGHWNGILSSWYLLSNLTGIKFDSNHEKNTLSIFYAQVFITPSTQYVTIVHWRFSQWL